MSRAKEQEKKIVGLESRINKLEAILNVTTDFLQLEGELALKNPFKMFWVDSRIDCRVEGPLMPDLYAPSQRASKLDAVILRSIKKAIKDKRLVFRRV